MSAESNQENAVRRCAWRALWTVAHACGRRVTLVGLMHRGEPGYDVRAVVCGAWHIRQPSRLPVP